MTKKYHAKKSICVFCGSRFGNQSQYKTAARELGEALAANEIRLVFGGGCVGLMGEVANAVISGGGEVLGVIPEVLIEKEIPHDKVTELIVVKTMHERKELMSNHADAFFVLPGGIGTLEEFFEVFTWQYLGIHHKPIHVLNIDGIFDHMLALINGLIQAGFMEQATLDKLIVFANIDDAIHGLSTEFPKSAPLNLVEQ